MLDAVLVVILIGLVALIAFGVVTGSWSGTWAGSGQTAEGRRFPGGPLHPTPRTVRGTYGADLIAPERERQGEDEHEPTAAPAPRARPRREPRPGPARLPTAPPRHRRNLSAPHPGTGAA